MRSDVPVGAVDSNWVGLQTVKAEQTRSDETVCAALSHSVERGSTTPLKVDVWHLDRTLAHVAPSSAELNVDMSMHPAQPRSVVAVPAKDWPWPTAQVCHGTQLCMSLTGANLPVGQATQVGGAELVALTVVYSPGSQTQSWLLQSITSISAGHALPPYWGCTSVRERDCAPPPHVTVHAP